MKAVILVPRRDDGGERDRLWAWCRQWWTDRVGLPIVEGHHDEGLFNRSAAVNRAAANAGDWDVGLLIDSDVICDPDRVLEAIDLAHGAGRVVLPFSTRYNLSGPGTRRVMAGERGSWKPYIDKTYHDMVSSCVAISRPAWDAVGGFDELFCGWGFEDTAWAAAVETMSEKHLLYIHGELWHLKHATAPEGRRGTPSFIANRDRAYRYEAAWGDREAMSRLIEEGHTAAQIAA